MNRVFWAECPQCAGRFVISWELRHSIYKLFCPFCRNRFAADDATWRDERYEG